MLRKYAIAAGASLLFALSLAPAGAQTAPQSGEMKKIGVPSHAKPEIIPSLIVMNAHGATLEGDKLTLSGVAPNVVIFADRPARSAGHALTAHFLEEWDPVAGADSFAKDPPNATVSVVDKDGSTVKDAVVELTSPKMEGADLAFRVKVLEGDLKGGDGPAAVFIDIIGLPFTPLSFAGVARRTARRAAFYAASAPPPPYRPSPYYPAGPACGVYPYPPCY